MGASIDGESGTRKIEYANLVLTIINEDIGRVHVRVTAALGLAAVFITQLPLGFRVTTLAGIVLLALAAVALFYYTHLLNRARIAIASQFVRAGGENVATEWSGTFGSTTHEPHIWLYNLGQWMFVIGGIALAVVIGKLLLP